MTSICKINIIYLINLKLVIKILLKLKIQRQNGNPIYKQIIEQIISMINKEILKIGDKLPPERELANELNVSRGTITKAYQELEKLKLIEIIQGRGSFITYKDHMENMNRKEKAISIINEAMNQLEELEFTNYEIKIFLDIMILEREKNIKNISIATIDCNPEALDIFKVQLSYIKNVVITRFLLNDLKRSMEPEQLLKEYDIIITTLNHYKEVANLIPNFSTKIIKAAVSPSQKTIINIAKISKNSKIGVVCFSKRFYGIIKKTLKDLNIGMEQVFHIYEIQNKEFSLEKFIKNTDIIIMPSDLKIKEEYKLLIEQYEKKGGIIINFEYQIERGTLIYIEESIREIMNNKRL